MPVGAYSHDVADLLVVLDTQLRPVWRLEDRHSIGRFCWALDGSALAFVSTEEQADLSGARFGVHPGTLQVVSAAAIAAGALSRGLLNVLGSALQPVLRDTVQAFLHSKRRLPSWTKARMARSTWRLQASCWQLLPAR